MTKLFLILSCILAVVADMLFVWWAKSILHPLWSMIMGMILLNITGIMWAYSMYKGTQSAIAITIYSLLTIIGCSMLGIFVFHEILTLRITIGLILGLIALLLILL